jgi:hypothetical protein
MGLPVLQGLPQDAQHLALASYDQNTDCFDVAWGNIRPTSYFEIVHIDFVDTTTPHSPGLAYNAMHMYTVCSDVTWSQYNFTFTPEEIGPVDTFLWFYNPCNSTATVRFNISRLPDGPGLLPACLIPCLRTAQLLMRLFCLAASCVFAPCHISMSPCEDPESSRYMRHKS